MPQKQFKWNTPSVPLKMKLFLKWKLTSSLLFPLLYHILCPLPHKTILTPSHYKWGVFLFLRSSHYKRHISIYGKKKQHSIPLLLYPLSYFFLTHALFSFHLTTKHHNLKTCAQKKCVTCNRMEGVLYKILCRNKCFIFNGTREYEIIYSLFLARILLCFLT